ncbi:MAG TPA: ABC transporter permease [Thermoanaerobaculia bacterium]|nr:ABC transporter permease [Thermoanaerobaculia bacterium]
MSWLQQISYGWRRLMRSPGSTAVVVLTLALGIGVNSAIFSIVNAALLRPLPFKDSERLVAVWTQFTSENQFKGKLSQPEVVDLRERARSLSDLAAFVAVEANLTGSGEPEQVKAAVVSVSFFRLLGVNPLLGRTFLADEEQPGQGKVVVLDHGFWQRRFGSDPEAVGRNLLLNGESYRIVGVMPPGFDLPAETDLWAPLPFDRANLQPRGAHYLSAIARLEPGVELDRAREELAALARQLQQENPDFYAVGSGWGIILVPILEEQVGELRPALLLLMCAGLLVLMISCANVANLRLARAQTEQRDVAIRAAFGASRWRLLGQLTTESMLASLLGGVLGLVLGWWSVELLVSFLPANVPRLQDASPDLVVIAFTLGLTFVTGALAALLPGLQVTRAGKLYATLKEAGTKASQSAGSRRLRSLLVVLETALALVVVIGAALLVKNVVRLQNISPGFNADRVLTLSLALPGSKYGTEAQIVSFYERLMARLRALPGVQAAGAVSHLPLSGRDYTGDFTVEGIERGPAATGYEASRRAASSDYFRAMGIPLLQGRAFSDSDHAAAQRVVIIDESLARRFWPRSSPLGRRLKFGKIDSEDPWLTIVGVVGHVKHRSLDVESSGQMYFPLSQFPRSEMFITLRTASPTFDTLAASAIRQVREIDPDLPISQVQPMEQWLARSLYKQHFSALLLTLFASVALILSVVGLHGVLASSTQERIREVGIRMALGANAPSIVRLLVGHGLLLAGIGIAIGWGIALALKPVLEHQLYRLNAADPAIYAGATLLLITMALLASYLPARRAARIEPVIALRHE